MQKLTETPTKPAGIRLRNLSVHAVAFVGEGANLARFAEIRKSKEQDPMADQNAAAGGGTMPAAARDTLVAELSKAVEALLAILDFLKAAPVSDDPAAIVPAEVTEKLEQIGMMVAALGSQFEPPEVAAPADAGAGVTAAAPEAPAPVAMSAEEATTMKAFGRRLALKMFRVVKARMESPAVTKAKVKLTFEQHASLQSKLMASLMNMMKEVAPLLNGMDETDVTAALAPPAADAPPVVDPEAEKKALELAAKALADAEAEKTAAVAKQKAMEANIATLRADLERIGKSRGASNAAPLETPAPVVPAEGEALHGRNLSAEHRAKKSKQAGVTPNAGPAQ